jgi:PAS domain S-box-containing protein
VEPSESVLRGLFVAAPDAMVVVDSRGTVVMLNDQAERMFGWRSDELIGRPIEVLVPAHLRDEHRLHRTAYVADRACRPMGTSGIRRDDSEFPVEISLSVVTSDDSETLVLAAIRDITERVRLEAELETGHQTAALESEQEQSRRLEGLGQLAGGVAHDFNNLLGVILNYSELIGRVVDDRSVQDDLAEIRTAAERGAALTRQLLNFARQDAVQSVPLDLNDVVRGLGPMLERTVGERIALHVTLADSPLVAEADRNQLEQVIVDLVLNAHDAMPDGGELTVTLDRAPTDAGHAVGDVTIRVSDTGSGMAPDVVKRAFEPFFTTKDRARGSGLGLASVYGVARRNGGDVQIDSVVGSGTAVTVRLPGSALVPRVDETDAPLVLSGREHVLLVEDEEPLRAATARLLETYGYRVALARDGVEALEQLEARGGEIDIVITDVVMPRMRGDELAVKVAERWNLPLILVSGHAPGAENQVGRTILGKPVDKDLLLRALREALDA